jgi:hypothetical protein
MCTTLVLVVPNFINNFVSECDSLCKGLREPLMQEGFPLEFTSKELCDHNFVNSTCNKEMTDILHVVETYPPYFIGRRF